MSNLTNIGTRKFLLYLILSFIIVLFALNEIGFLDSEKPIEEIEQPEETKSLNEISLYDFVGICGGQTFDQYYLNKDTLPYIYVNANKSLYQNPASFFSKVRYFKQNEEEYRLNGLDVGMGSSDFYACEDLCNCQPWRGISNHSFRYNCKYDTIQIQEYASETLYLFGELTNFPNKHFPISMVGRNRTEVSQRYKFKGEVYSKTYPHMRSFEMNEYWNKKNLWAYRAMIQGLKSGLRKDVILKSTSVQAMSPTLGNPLYSNWWRDILFDEDGSLLPHDVVTGHFYSFVNGVQSGTANDLIGKPEGLYLDNIRALKDSLKYNGIDLPIELTEGGYNSLPLGEEKQSAYILRQIFLGMSEQLQGYYIYELVDQPSVYLFNSTGLINKDFVTPKKAWHDITDYLTFYGSYHYLETVQETDTVNHYVYTNTLDTLNLVWSTDDKNRIYNGTRCNMKPSFYEY